MSVARRSVLGAGIFTLALATGCVRRFQTYFANPVSADVSREWTVTSVQVSVPQTLSVSEEKSWEPKADIVWREDPVSGDRHAQVAAIMTTAAELGVAGLDGPRPVALQIWVSRFHALTFEAETELQDVGVHNIDFIAQIVDIKTGKVLAGPEVIDAAMPAMSGRKMLAARQQGETQKSQITAHVRDVIAGWLGAGPDPRMTFSRRGK